ncbi:MAG: B12-binding domain-containing radical SAM protein [Actinobacteria bacterium]|nr:B12-binding domain-containing radical SAM protein [Actinomycetota bacterium]MCL6094141.1 B12-binding domain-containing radical SAM protein [Actinomycetota bacterium]
MSTAIESQPMRVLFLNPPPVDGVNVVREGRCMQRTGAWTAVWAPVSLATTAAVLREQGMDVKLADCSVEDVDRAGLAAIIRGWQPQLVVINTATPSIESDIAVASLVREAAPAARSLAMGIHPSALPESCFDMDANLDMVVRGEPEYTIRDAALALRDGGDLGAVAGLSWRDAEGALHAGEKRPFIADLDELPFPAWDLIDTGGYRLPFTGQRFLLVASARGCPYGCTFCANKIYYGARLRQRSPKRIVDEMQWAGEQFGIRDFLIWSESFTNDQEYAIETAEEIRRRGLDISWVCNSRVDTVSPELLRAIRDAGCWMIGYGIESGSQEVLDSVRKGTTLTQAVSAVRMAHDTGLEVTGHCILGFPGETEATMQATIDFSRFLKLDYVQFYCAVAFPGSSLYDRCVDNGWIEEGADWKYFEQNFSVLTTPQLTARQVMSAREKAYRQFYLQPHVVLSSLKKIRRPGDVINFARMVKDFLTWV